MSLNESNFFDNVGGSGAPSAKLQQVDDFVVGTVDEQFMTVATDFSTKKPKLDAKTGKEIEQLVIILQTEQRNWAGVTKIPKVDKDDASSADKPASEDDGRRAVYVEPWTNIHAAIGTAVQNANNGQKGPVRNGAKLGVKITALKDTGKGNPLKVHQAFYEPPAAGSEFFNQTAATEAPAQQAAPAVQEQAAAPAAAPAPQQDPWSGQPVATGDKPPF